MRLKKFQIPLGLDELNVLKHLLSQRIPEHFSKEDAKAIRGLRRKIGALEWES